MDESDLIILTTGMTDLLVKMFRSKFISYETFINNTGIKIDFLKACYENSAPEHKHTIAQTLEQYHSCQLSDL